MLNNCGYFQHQEILVLLLFGQGMKCSRAGLHIMNEHFFLFTVQIFVNEEYVYLRNLISTWIVKTSQLNSWKGPPAWTDAIPGMDYVSHFQILPSTQALWVPLLDLRTEKLLFCIPSLLQSFSSTEKESSWVKFKGISLGRGTLRLGQEPDKRCVKKLVWGILNPTSLEDGWRRKQASLKNDI